MVGNISGGGGSNRDIGGEGNDDLSDGPGGAQEFDMRTVIRDFIAGLGPRRGNISGFRPGINPEMGGSLNRFLQVEGAVPHVVDSINKALKSLGVPGSIDRLLERSLGDRGGGANIPNLRGRNERVDPRGEFSDQDRFFHPPPPPGPRPLGNRTRAQIRAATLLTRGISRGRAGIKLTAAQRRELNRLTRTQQSALGVFRNRTKTGGIVDPKKIRSNASNRLLAGKSLNVRQNILVGQAIKNMSSGKRRDLAAALGGGKAALNIFNAALRTSAAATKTGRAQAARSSARVLARAQKARVTTAVPLRNLSAAARQQVLLARAVARRQSGVGLNAAQRAALQGSTRAQRQPLARGVQQTRAAAKQSARLTARAIAARRAAALARQRARNR